MLQDQFDDADNYASDKDCDDSILGTIANALHIKWFINPIFLLMAASKRCLFTGKKNPEPV